MEEGGITVSEFIVFKGSSKIGEGKEVRTTKRIYKSNVTQGAMEFLNILEGTLVAGEVVNERLSTEKEFEALGLG